MKFNRKKKGVPRSYHAWWKYRGIWRETKVKPGLWRLSFRAWKNRKAKSYGSHPKGRRIRWKITAIQDVIKTDKGKYITHMYGNKKLIRAGKNKLR